MKKKNWIGFKAIMISSALIFIGVFIYAVAFRLDSVIIAVLAGSVCGAGAGIPLGLFIMRKKYE